MDKKVFKYRKNHAFHRSHLKIQNPSTRQPLAHTPFTLTLSEHDMSHFGRSGPPDIRDTYSLLVLNITFRIYPSFFPNFTSSAFMSLSVFFLSPHLSFLLCFFSLSQAPLQMIFSLSSTSMARQQTSSSPAIEGIQIQLYLQFHVCMYAQCRNCECGSMLCTQDWGFERFCICEV